MKKLLIWFLSVLGLIVTVDIAVGFFFDKITESNPMKGDYHSVSYLINDLDDDVLILGSSVGLNSINTVTLSDSLGVSAYSGASNGQTMPFFNTMLKIALNRPNPPKTILLGILDNNLTDTGLGDRYNFLAPYYGKGIADIDQNFDNLSKLHPYLMKSRLYRLNTAWVRILLYYFYEPGIKSERGFIAKPVPSIFPTLAPRSDEKRISSERRGQIIEFAKMCKDNGIRLIVFFPPQFIENNSPALVSELREILAAYGATLWHDTSLEPFRSDPTLFYDNNHININGSKIYTDTVINRLKKEPTDLKRIPKP